VVIGRRIVNIKVVSEDVQQLAVGAGDSESFAEIARLFHHRPALECSIDLHHLAPRLSINAARTELNRLRADQSVGTVIAVGSQVTNPMAIPVAEEILRSSPSSLPSIPSVAISMELRTLQSIPNGPSTSITSAAGPL
jgi:hypothetical protein